MGAFLLVVALPWSVSAEDTGLKITIHPPPTPKVGQDASKGFSGGQQAYAKGNFVAAYEELLPLAVEGNPDAQFYIGRIYDPSNEDRIGVTAMPVSPEGTPIIQDYKHALTGT